MESIQYSCEAKEMPMLVWDIGTKGLSENVACRGIKNNLRFE